MGWFSNSFSLDRAANGVGLMAAGAMLEDAKNTLSTASQFVGQQKQRGNQLSAQAFSVQGASSFTGRSLQQAINDLCNFERDSSALANDLDERIEMFEYAAQQFSLPRLQRSLNMSSRDMAVGMVNGAAEGVQNLNALKNQHWNKVSSAITTIDNADIELNGASGRRARASLPSLD